MTVQSDPMFAPTKASAPYAGTAGYAPVEQSKQAARGEVASGRLVIRQRMILQMLQQAALNGLTSGEIEKQTGEGHGRISGALSSMHKDGAISALKLQRRNGCGVYVLPEFVNGRQVREFVSVADSKVRDDVQPTAPARPHLSESELETVERFRAVTRQAGDRIFQIRPTSAKALLAIIDRLNA